MLASRFSWSQNKKNLLAIFAHPDDESAIGEVLVKYAKLGHKVQVIIATDGKDGTRVTKSRLVIHWGRFASRKPTAPA